MELLMVFLAVSVAGGGALRHMHQRQQLLAEVTAFEQMRVELRRAAASCSFLPINWRWRQEDRIARSREEFREFAQLHDSLPPLAASQARSWRIQTTFNVHRQPLGRIQAVYDDSDLARELSAHFAGLGWPSARDGDKVRLFLAPLDMARFNLPGRNFWNQYEENMC